MNNDDTIQNETARLDGNGDPAPSEMWAAFEHWYDTTTMGFAPHIFPSLAIGALQKEVYNAMYLLLRDKDELFKQFLPEFGIIQISVDDPAVRVSLLDVLVADMNRFGFPGTKWFGSEGRRIIHIPVPN